MASAQTGVSIERGRLAGEATAEAPSPSTAAPSTSAPSTSDGSEQKKTDQGAPAAKPGSVIGTLLDESGAVSVGTVVRITLEDKSDYREVITGGNGQFSFSNVPAGHFQLSVSSLGFGNEVYSGDLAPGQTFLAPPIVLSVATVVTQVNVTVDSVQVATEEIKEEEHQRVLGFIPNFYGATVQTRPL